MTLEVRLGDYLDGSTCTYDISRAVNPHSCFVGMSGAGKTHLIKRMSTAFCSAGMTVFMVDAQGDLEGIPGAVDIPFRYQGAHGSINPMRVDPDPHGGGVFLAVRQTLHVLRMFYPSLGARQEADFRKLILLAYARNNILPDNPATWLNPPPTLETLHQLAHEVQLLLLTGSHEDVLEMIQRARSRVLAAREDGDEATERAEKEKLQAAIIALVERGINNELNKERWDLKRLEAIEHVLSGIVATGLFSGDDLSLKPRRINRFDLNKLHPLDQQVMMYLLLERVFEWAKRSCTRFNDPVPRLMLILDEGKYAAARMDDVLSPLNRIATEGRKFGLGMVLGVQSLSHLTEDVLENFGMQVILKLSQQACDKAARLFKVQENVLAGLVPKRDALFSMNGSRFQSIRLSS